MTTTISLSLSLCFYQPDVTIRSSHFFLLLYETLRDDADFFFELSDPRKASKCLSCALQTNEIFKKFTCSDCLTEKDVSTAHLKLATIAMMMDNFETALTHCNICIELTPSFAKVSPLMLTCILYIN